MNFRLFCLLALSTLSASLSAAEPRHQVVPDWPKLPQDHVLGVCAGIGVDVQNRVFVFHRGSRKWSNPFPKEPIAEPTVSVFDGTTGALLSSWGADRFIMPHGLTVDPDGNLWLTDVGLHQVFQCTPEGEVLRTLGEAGIPGTDENHFNLPTDVAALPDGSFYISDGYKNTRVMKFSADGQFQHQWGSKGTNKGEFNLPHGLALDVQGNVYVCDRENHRIQVFDAVGKVLHSWSGPEIGKPYGIATGAGGQIYIIDGGLPSLKAGQRGKAVVLDAMGRVRETFGSQGTAPGEFQLGHDIAVGPEGSIYVAEATGARVQKFIRRQ